MVDVVDAAYLMLDGHGDPNASAWVGSVEARYPGGVCAEVREQERSGP